MTSMFGHEVRSDLLLLYLIETITVFFAVFAVVAFVAADTVGLDHVRVGVIAATVSLCCGVAIAASGLYQAEVLSHVRRLVAGATVASLLLVLLVWLSVELLTPTRVTSRWGIVAAVLLGCVLGISAARLAIHAALRRGLFAWRILLLRDGGAPLLVEPLAADGGTRAVLGELRPQLVTEADALRPAWLRKHRIWAIVAADPCGLAEVTRTECEKAGVRILSEDDIRECRLNRVACDRLPSDWLATARVAKEGRAEAALRRALDIAVSLVLLTVTLPVWAVAAAIVSLDSPGPIFYRQERVGQHGRRFTLCKFRSMVADAEAGGTARWAVPGDPRVTRFGRFMRLTRIDELPQILNVLRGDMSIVGPRPERPSFVEELGRIIPHYHDRERVKPGITGWAQVNYPYGASVEDARMKLAYDLYYVRRRSLFLDMLILIATVRVVLFQEGAR